MSAIAATSPSVWKMPLANEAEKGDGECFGKFKTDSTYVPDDVEELLPFDNDDSDDEDGIVVSRQFANTSWSTSASAGRRLGGGLLKDDAQDKSPWSSPIAAAVQFASFGDLSNDNVQEKVEDPVPSNIIVSVGSELHGLGDCKPCAWFWKPQGCQNGSECLHCHLCPKSEVKARKKMKARERKAAPVSEAAEEQVDWEAMPVFRPPPGLTQMAPETPPGIFIEADLPAESPKLCEHLDTSSEATTTEGCAEVPESPPESPDGSDKLEADATSLGSALHLSGLCKPCAWFWKPQGCGNGADCLHCHLCPQGEVKRRKKQKKAASQEFDEDAEEQLPQPELIEVPQASLQLQAQQMIIQQQQRQLMQMQVQLQLQEQQVRFFAQTQAALATAAMAKPELASKGSAGHSTGACKPCAWMWKAQGCENGMECEYCHACPPGEAKLRKKAKEAQKTLAA